MERGSERGREGGRREGGREGGRERRREGERRRDREGREIAICIIVIKVFDCDSHKHKGKLQYSIINKKV